MFALFGHHSPPTPHIPNALRATLRWQAGRRRFALHAVWENGSRYHDRSGGAVLAALAGAPMTDFFPNNLHDPIACRTCRHFEAADQDVPAFVFPNSVSEGWNLVGRVHPPQPPTCALCGGLMEPISLTAHELLALKAKQCPT